jgi:hypothetical protein
LIFPEECHSLFFGNCNLSPGEEFKQHSEGNTDQNKFSFKLPVTPSSEYDESVIFEVESLTPPLTSSSGIYSVEVVNVTNSYPNINIPIKALSDDDVIVYVDDIPSNNFKQKKVCFFIFFFYFYFFFFVYLFFLIDIFSY